MTYSDMPDNALIVAAASDAEAFGHLYDRYLPQVFAYVASRLPCRTEAEDVTSDVWMKITRNIKRFSPKRKESVPAWIFAIARNAITDAHRKRREYVDIDINELPEMQSEERLPGSALDARQKFLALQTRIDALPAMQARCLRLRFYAGLRNKEIAQLEGIQEKTVAAHMSRALESVRANSSSLATFPPLA